MSDRIIKGRMEQCPVCHMNWFDDLSSGGDDCPKCMPPQVWRRDFDEPDFAEPKTLERHYDVLGKENG